MILLGLGLAMLALYLAWDYLGIGGGETDPRNVALVLGAGTTFLGVYTSVMATETYVKSEVISSDFTAGMENLDRIIRELSVEGQGIYLPADYVGEPRAFLPVKRGDISLPDLRGDPTFLTGADASEPGILIFPPGHRLCDIAQREMEVDIEALDPEALATILPPLLSVGLGLAGSIEIDESDLVVTLTEPASRDLYESGLEAVRRLGCPICSCVCEALCRSMDTALRIESLEYDPGRGKVKASLARLEG